MVSFGDGFHIINNADDPDIYLSESQGGAILRMVEDRYRLRPLTVRDAKANSIATAFDFDQKPREPPHLPTPPSLTEETLALLLTVMVGVTSV